MSRGSVDRVIHKRGKVAKETEEKIAMAITELNYQPNILASRLKSDKIYTIAVILPKSSLANKYWDQHLEGINKAQQSINQFGIQHQVFHFDQSDRASFHSIIPMIVRSKFDALMVVPIFIEEVLILLKKYKNTPCVFLDTQIEYFKEIPFIGQNAYDSGAMAAQLLSYILNPGDSIAIITTASKFDNHLLFEKRKEGFKNFFNENKSSNKIYDINETIKGHGKNLNKILQNHPEIKAIFSVNTKVHLTAAYLIKKSINHLFLIGYDLVEQNINYLKKGNIQLLLHQRPVEQSYSGIIMLYKHLIFKEPLKLINYTPIDVISKINLKYYI